MRKEVDYASIEDRLLNFELIGQKITFVGDEEVRKSSALELNGCGLEGLGIIGFYHHLREQFQVGEPHDRVEEILYEIWDKRIKRYSGLCPEEILRRTAYEILGYVPLNDEIIQPDKYDRIYRTFESLTFEPMPTFRLDGEVFGDSAPKFTIERILIGLRKIPTWKSTH